MDRETLLRWGRSSWWRSLLWSVTCFLSTTLAVGVGEARADRGAGRVPDDMAGGLWVLFWFVGMLLILLMWWRRRWTWQVAVVTSLVTIAIPIDPLVATVVLDGTTALDPAVGQNAYRVVQELLTNARRHAPGAGVRLAVVSRPDLGVTVEVANRTGSPHIVEGNGLTGLRERVAQSGGETHLHVDDQGALRVAVRLPWRAALAPTEAPT